MVEVNYNNRNNKFEVYVKCDEYEEFIETISEFKKMYLPFDKETKKWNVPDDRIDEFYLWMIEKGIDVIYTDYCLQKVQDIKKELYPKELISTRNRFDKSILNDGIKLYDYQLRIINHHLGLNRVWNALDAGTGKSIIATCQFSTFYNQGKIDKIFIVVPIGMSYHWKHEILKFVNVFKESDIGLINNKNKKKIFDNPELKEKKILIIPNHLLADMLLSYKKSKTDKKSGVRWKSFVDFKKEWGSEKLFLLVDESHLFKKTTSLRSKALSTIIQYFDYRTFLTATPFIQRIEDAFSNTVMLDHSLIPMNEKAFRLWISEEIGDRFDPYNVIRYNENNVKEFLDSLHPMFIKINKEDLDEMKHERIVKSINLKMEKTQWEIYKKVAGDILYKLEEEYNKIRWRMIYNSLPTMLQTIDCPMKLKGTIYEDKELNSLIRSWKKEKDPKLNMLDNLLNDYIKERNEKVIVFCQYPENLDYFYEKYKHFNPIIIHGATEKDKEREREEKRLKFSNDPECKLALLSFLTSSAGGNWQKSCNRMIYYSLPWDATLTRQSLDRTHRITSTEDTIIEILNFPSSIDALRYEKSMARIDLNEKLGQEVDPDELMRLLQGIV